MSSARRTSPITPLRIESPSTDSQPLLLACAGFGVIPCPPAEETSARAPIPRIDLPGITLIIGPSGTGKSTLLRTIAQYIPHHKLRIVPAILTEKHKRTAVFDLLDGNEFQRAATLTKAGLAEPSLWPRAAGTLSEGEQARLRFALAMHRANADDVVIADEFASTLDRLTAYAVACTAQRWAQSTAVQLIAASAHEDLASMLPADRTIDARTGTIAPAQTAHTQTIRIEPGTPEDYHALSHLHYRSGNPASVVRILRAIREVPAHLDPSGQILAGVLIVRMPTLNNAHRHRAWGEMFSTGNKPHDARQINAHLRTISRVIVDPRSRGLGIATMLVRAYLDNPLTPCTEATAAMGSLCPFFERAGMTPFEIYPDHTDLRLLDALTHMRIQPHALLGLQPQPNTLLMRELTTWARARKLIHPDQNPIESIARLTPIAACRLCSRPRAYAFLYGGEITDDHDPPALPATTDT